MQNIKKVKTTEIMKNIQPIEYTDGTLEYLVQGFNKDGKGCFERTASTYDKNLDKLKKDLTTTIKCAGYNQVETIKVNGTDIQEYLVF